MVVLLTQVPATVEAHANYVESDPAANSVVDESPERVTIRFTEPLEPALSEIEVYDSQGGLVDGGDSAVDPSDPLVMSVSVEELADGTYTVAWKNVSTVDGHRVRGAFVFSVGTGFIPAPTDVVAVEVDQPLFQSPADPVIRWLVLLGVLTIVGAVTFHLLVSRPVIGGHDAVILIPSLTGSLSRVVVIAAGVLLAASVVQLIVQASVVFESSLVGALGGPVWDLLMDTEWGRLWLWRVALGAASSVAVIAGWRRGDNPALLTLGAVLGAASLLTISLTSHAAATVNVRTQAILNDFIHLVVVAVWVGGLIALIAGVRVIMKTCDGVERREILSALVRRFSLVAGISVVVIILTGLYSAWAQVVTVPALQVPYGRVLGIKVAVVVGLLLVAAANLVWVRPRLRAGGTASTWLKRLVAAEVVLAVIVLLAVGFLTSLEPARQVASREGIGVESELAFQEVSEGARMALEIDPGLVGPNTVHISLTDLSGSPITNATDVRVRLSYLDADFGEIPYSATEVGAGEFALEDQLISIAGAWQVELVVQRPDAFDARAAFRFEVTGGSGGSLAIAPEADTGRALLGIEFVVLGFLFMGISIPIGGWYSRQGAGAMVVGAVAVIAGGALLFGTLGAGEGLPERNPIAPTQESVTLGMGLYVENCQLCHGVGGLGDGRGGVGLNPPPADLTVHVPLHPDRALFEFIRDGVPGTAMAPLGDKLSEDEIWHVINYIQTLE
ncbi:MAG: copper resistance protein CopC [Dehalococcoidia bacterium]|nr:copper resistance protein CopC [Dehalococcoidia bacterium]